MVNSMPYSGVDHKSTKRLFSATYGSVYYDAASMSRVEKTEVSRQASGHGALRRAVRRGGAAAPADAGGVRSTPSPTH